MGKSCASGSRRWVAFVYLDRWFVCSSAASVVVPACGLPEDHNHRIAHPLTGVNHRKDSADAVHPAFALHLTVRLKSPWAGNRPLRN